MINILTGPVHSGKTTLLKNALFSLKNRDLAIDGYLSEAIWDGRNFLGYDLYDLKNHRYHPFMRKKGQEEWQRIGSFYFLPGMLDIAMQIIRQGGKADLCVVDEVGPLELEGQGVWPALKDVLMAPTQDLLLVVRNSILKIFIGKIQTEEVVVYDVERDKKAAYLAESLLRDIDKRRKSLQE